MNLDLSLIFSVLKTKQFFETKRLGVDPSCFEVPVAREIWKFLDDFWAGNKSVPSVEVVVAKFDLSDVHLPEEPPKFWAEEVLRRKLYDRINNLGAVIKQKLDSNDLDGVENELRSYSKSKRLIGGGATAVQYGQELNGVWSQYLAFKAGESGINTPWPEMQEWTMGWFKKDMSVIVGRPGVGKSWMSILCADAANLSGHKVTLFSAEMTKEDMMQRHFCVRNKIPYGNFRKGRLSFADETRVKSLIDRGDADWKDISIADGSTGVRIDALEAVIAESDSDLIVVDSVYRIRPAQKTKDRFEALALVMDDIKLFCQTYDKAILVTTQLNREATRRDSNSGMELADIAMSDVVGWNATNVIGILRSKEDMQNRVMKIHPIKVREGASGDPLTVNWDFGTMNFAQFDKNSSEDEDSAPW